MNADEAGAQLWEKTFPKILAKAWTDDAFKQRLLSAPGEVFKEYGLPLIAGASYQVKEGASFSTTVAMTIPPKPPDLAELSMEDAIVGAITRGPPGGPPGHPPGGPGHGPFSCF